VNTFKGLFEPIVGLVLWFKVLSAEVSFRQSNEITLTFSDIKQKFFVSGAWNADG
jgi:hypothetical protein